MPDSNDFGEMAPIAWLMGDWTSRLAEILKSMTDEQPRVEWKAAAESPSDFASVSGQPIFWWEQSFNVTPECPAWAGTPSKTWLELGSRTLRAAGMESVEEADARNTYLEILSQSLSGMAQAMTGHFQREVTCDKGGETPPPPTATGWISVEIRYQDGAPLPVFLAFHADLLRRLEAPDGRSTSEEEPPPEIAPEASPSPGERTYPPRTLSLLLEVELPVSVSFGRAELPLKEVLKLTTGSIIELNRGISEPVEVLVNNCVVARGEVVVMEGNYGVRIDHIVSPQDRLRTLR